MYDAETIKTRLIELIDSRGNRIDTQRSTGVTVTTMYCWGRRTTLPQMGTFVELLKCLKPTASELLWVLDYEDKKDEPRQ